MAYSQSWLENSSAIRVILVEAEVFDVTSNQNITVYLSNAGYLTTSGNISFLPIISSDVTFNESISEKGSTAMSISDIEIYNNNGEYDTWLDASLYIWNNKAIKVYYGDPRWDTANISDIRTKFLTIFDGIINNIDSRGRNQINFKIRDKLERLNAPITEAKLGTYGNWSTGQTNKDDIKPLVFGEPHNVIPLLIDPSQLEYMFNDGAAEGVTEIRDNGVPIYTRDTGLTGGAIINNTAGTFKLTAPAVGTITVSVQGLKKSVNLSTGSTLDTYNNNIANIIALIVTYFGKASTKFSGTDLDLTNFSNFASANLQAVGITINDRTNVLTICEQLASSVGAQLYINRIGKLQLLKYGVAYGTPLLTQVTEADIVINSLEIKERPQIIAATKLAYAKNWAVQGDLVTAIPEEDKNSFGTEWLTVTEINSVAKNKYSLTEDPIQKDTLLIVTSEASAEALRLNNFNSQQRTVFKFTGMTKCLSLFLGQELNILHSRFGLYNNGSGKTGQVIGLTPNWSTNKVEVEVLI